MEIIYKKILDKFAELEKQMLDPKILINPQNLKKHSIEYNELKPLVGHIRELDKLENQLRENQQIIQAETDAGLISLASQELGQLETSIQTLKDQLAELTRPRDARDKKDVIMEIRAGAGGDEAALFAGDLLRMYTRFAETKGWRTSLLSASRIGLGGFKEIIFEVNGQEVFKNLKYESGVHRVQRIPATEKSGRVHTSTATVAVLPVAEDVEINLKPEDLKIDVFRSSGPGGQSVNTTDSAVRLTHKPSGLVVSCQDEKSQLQNREKAMRILKSKLLQMEEERRNNEEREARKSQVGSGGRSEKIRTYNFPQDRLTDHRLKQSWHGLESIMDGGIADITETLKKAA